MPSKRHIWTIVMAATFITCAPYGKNLTSYSIIGYASFIVLHEYVFKRNFRITKSTLIRLFVSTFPVLMILISFFYAPDKELVSKILERNLAFLIFPILFIPRIKVPEFKYADLVIFTYIVSLLVGIIYIYVKLSLKVYSSEDTLLDIFRWKYSYGNLLADLPISANYFSFYLFSAVVLINSYSWNRNVSFIFKILFSTPFIFSIIHLNTRSIIVLLIIYLFFAIILANQSKIVKIVGLTITFTILTVLIANMDYLVKRKPFELKNGVLKITDKRINRWKSTLEVFDISNIWFGFGAGNAKQALTKAYLNNELEIAAKNNYNTHNQYLQNLLEYGVFGTLLFLIFICYSLSCAIKIKSEVLIILIFSFLVFSITESTLKRQKGIVFLAFISAVSVRKRELVI